MAKVLVGLFSSIRDGNSCAVPCFYESFVDGLKSLGNDVLVFVFDKFNTNFKALPDNIKNNINEFNPDLCVLFNNTFYDISSIVDCPIVIYEVDSPMYYCNKDALKKSIDRYKFIVSQDTSVDELKDNFGAQKRNVIALPFFSEIKVKNENCKNNICFIGSKFLDRRCKLQVRLNNDDKKLLLYLLDQTHNYFEYSDIFKNKANETIKASFDQEFFIGLQSGRERTNTLSAIADLGLSLYGPPSWNEAYWNDPVLVLSYNNDVVYSKKHNELVYNSHRIGININHLQAVTGYSWRVHDIMASNACLVSSYNKTIKERFNNIIPMFCSPYEARELCIKLLNNENQRKDIVEHCNDIVDKNFRLKNILPGIEALVGINLSNKGLAGNVRYIDCRFPYNVKLKYKIIKSIYKICERKLRRKGLV